MHTSSNSASSAKISRPEAQGAVPRQRLNRQLEAAWEKPIIWISSPAGSGKTTLVSSFLRDQKAASIWYQCDQGDADLSTFFYYLAMASRKTNPRASAALPLLTPEYLLGIPTFTKRFFEELGDCFPQHAQGAASPVKPSSGGVIVFDNYQDVPVNAPFHDILALGLETLPAHVRTVIVSRHDPPRQFARLQANNTMNFIGWEDLQCTLEETDAIVRGQLGDASPEVMADLHEKTDGWLASLILALERSKRFASQSPVSHIPTSETLFEYFDGEIFSKETEKERTFLLTTSFLPEVSVAHAEALTGQADAGRMLSILNRRHFFTEKLSGKGMGYRYHPLFRDFLQLKATTEFSADEASRIKKEAARLLEQSGRMEDAVRLYRDAADIQGLSLMVIRHGENLMRQGRYETVKEWLGYIPPEIVETNPWLVYWTGMCSFPLDMPRTRTCLGKALEIFRAAGDATGAFISWAGIVDSHALQLDDWRRLDDIITIFDGLVREFPSFPSAEIELIASSRMLLALTVLRTDQPDLVREWLERVTTLLRERPALEIRVDTAFNLCVYHMWKGEYNKVGLLLERLDAEIRQHAPHPFTEIRIRFMRGDYFLVTGQLDAAQQNFAEGLAISAESGVHLVDFFLYNFKAAASLATGDMEAAKQALWRNTEHLPYAMKLDRFFYHIYSAWYEVLTDSPARAASHLEDIHTLTEEMGTPYYRSFWRICMAHVALLQGRSEEAKSLVLDSLLISRKMKSFVLEWFGLLTNAYIFLIEGNDTEGVPLLRSGMALGRAYDYSHLEFCLTSFMRLLCVKALEHGIEPEYAGRLIRKYKMTPVSNTGTGAERRSSARLADVWPYPINIRTLGRFEIIKDDKPLAFAGKPPKKALELLKALIAFSGRDVTIYKLADALRPDSEGDKAYSSIKVDLHNLRRLLGDEAVITTKGKISLNFDLCCVDTDVFLGLAEDVPASEWSQNGTGKDWAPASAEKALELYRGNFMEDEEECPYYAALGERLRSRFVRLVDTMGSLYESGKEWRRAIELYKKGIRHDEQQESFYHSLIRCHEQLGESREAAHVRERRRRIIHENF